VAKDSTSSNLRKEECEGWDGLYTLAVPSLRFGERMWRVRHVNPVCKTG